ncbi:hypothetical protein [Kitasatospora sp. NBC_01300]|uniref:hypothetical protein n=1 Tax=Kitasatospora sp. NBC_01300 TaxID=2903574 RepID=UPI00352E86DB|nr:hypothetical protein OG556_02160 [Kitasatospora sp. NBC_01300]
MRAGLRGPAPPPAAAVLRATALGLAGACALLAGAAAPAAAGGGLITLVDNSNADSWVEIDRTANVQNGSGSAGSDHDGAGSLVGGLLGSGPGGAAIGGGR